MKLSKDSWYDTTVGDNKIHVGELDDDFLDYAIGAIETDGLDYLDEI